MSLTTILKTSERLVTVILLKKQFYYTNKELLRNTIELQKKQLRFVVSIYSPNYEY